ncbi:MAG TPA: pectinesterase family protein [Verrucomicrobiae bacterium]|nr:pectinesterase family protein [Verrucomicrobiae bacterium]
MKRPAIAFALLFPICVAFGSSQPKPDLVVAADGSGNFKTIQAAVESIPATNLERVIVFIKDGTYHEKVRVDAPFVTLQGQSRTGTRIEFPQENDDFTAKPDDLGRAVLNLNNADDFVLQNLTVENTAGVIGPHAFAVYGTGDRTVIVDCDVLSHGADTVSLWLGEKGRYYHARCNFAGSVDFVCPRGWCYATDCNFYEYKDTASVWHDGKVNPEMKFVLRNCHFDGTNGFNLGRHHADANFYFLDCKFTTAMADKPIHRVIYPLGGAAITDADTKRNTDLDKVNLHGEREYFYDCHRAGGDFNWFANNLQTAPGAPRPKDITAAWTFANQWNPENNTGPTIRQLRIENGDIGLAFTEPVTVKGKPTIRIREGGTANYVSGSGTDTLLFEPTSDAHGFEARDVQLNGGAIIACEADATLRMADLSLHTAQKTAKKLYSPVEIPTPVFGQHMLHPDQ